MPCWINGPATGGIDDKIKMANILLKANIPAFHHSIIPLPGQIRKLQINFISSVSCRNSETFNYYKQEIIKSMANQVGKRYICTVCGAEFIVTRGGDGELHCCGKKMEIKK